MAPGTLWWLQAVTFWRGEIAAAHGDPDRDPTLPRRGRPGTPRHHVALHVASYHKIRNICLKKIRQILFNLTRISWSILFSLSAFQSYKQQT